MTETQETQEQKSIKDEIIGFKYWIGRTDVKTETGEIKIHDADTFAEYVYTKVLGSEADGYVVYLNCKRSEAFADKLFMGEDGAWREKSCMLFKTLDDALETFEKINKKAEKKEESNAKTTTASA